ncbi:MAG: zinc transporter ZntB [Alphaproteobacteria bacterium]|nr:zinc transporter ZntB [Alphaproteobacteria bacterium]
MTDERDDDGLIVGLLLDGKGGARAVGWPEIRAWVPEAGVLWVHLNRTKENAEAYIRTQAGLDEVVVDALLVADPRPRVVPQANGLIVNFRGVNFNPGADPEDMISVRGWVQKRRIVTTRARRLMATKDIEARLARGVGPKDEIDCLFELARALLSRVGHVVEELSDAVDALEDQVVSGDVDEVREKLGETRKRTIAIRRHLAPQREALVRLQGEKHEMLDAIDSVHFRELADETTRYIEELDSVRERASVVQDEVLNRLTERQNRNSYVLTIVAAIMLPLSFITSLFGVSVQGIPFASDPDAFWVLLAILAVLVALEVAVFKWTKWF